MQLYCHYALERMPNKVLAKEYRMALPDVLAEGLEHTRRMMEVPDECGEMSFPMVALGY